jgi:hypothetical protein
MRRSGMVVAAAALACALFVSAAPAGAETPREWFVEAKRVGKTIRIAHATGRLEEVRDLRPVVRDLQLRIGVMPLTTYSGSCQSLASGLFYAVEAAQNRDALGVERALRHHDLVEERCLSGINAASR